MTISESSPDENIDNIKDRFFLSQKEIFFALSLLLILIAGILVIIIKFNLVSNINNKYSKSIITPDQNLTIKSFISTEDFKNYINSSYQASRNSSISSLDNKTINSGISIPQSNNLGVPQGSISSQDNNLPVIDRVSDTNSQVLGVDEPDIVKSDGLNIYYSTQNNIIYSDTIKAPIIGSVNLPFKPGIYPGVNLAGKTRIIQSNPIDKLSEVSEINNSGNLILDNSNLLIISPSVLNSYNIQDAKNPILNWSYDIKNGTSIINSREYNSRLYLILANNISVSHPCPYYPVSTKGLDIVIPCISIYHPINTTQIDTTYTVLSLDMQTGKILSQVAFVGNPQSIIYMSQNNLYITYTRKQFYYNFLYQFLLDKGGDIVSPDILAHLENVSKLDISDQAKASEIEYTLNKYQADMSDDQKLKYQNDLQNKLKDYASSHIRDLTISGIAKIDINNFNNIKTAEIPGSPLNQFSMDEYQGNIRISTTSNTSIVGSTDSINDLYILDSNLQNIGSVTNLGQGEKIFATRFVNDKAYLVTFKQTDPFFVIDLSDPKQPMLKGQLKIPGNSSYLHPISDQRILGIGQEGIGIKVGLFDVSDPQNPTQIDKYNLDEYWSLVSNNHHAFLIDKKYNVFFFPGGKGGYIFSYQADKLNLLATIAMPNINRAIFINNLLYVLSDTKLVVLDENNWQQIKSLTLN